MNLLTNNLENNLNKENEIIKTEDQTKFIETTLGRTINFGLDIGLRALLPDYIEQQVIDIKNTLMQEGFSNGIKKVISSAIDFGKSAIGIVTGNFENVSQVQAAIQKGGIIDGISDTIDFVLNKTQQTGILPYNITKAIKTGKNTILNNVANNIENEFNKQLESAEKLQKYSNNWKQYYNNKDFEGMTRELYKINAEIKNLIPLENTIKEARTIQNLHNLIRTNGRNFNLTNEQLELAKMLN